MDKDQVRFLDCMPIYGYDRYIRRNPESIKVVNGEIVRSSTLKHLRTYHLLSIIPTTIILVKGIEYFLQ